MVRYSNEIIDEIINSNDIVDVISQYVVLKRSGRNFFGLCPFHKEKTPSFSVSPDKQIFHCFGCGVGGNVIHFVSKIENIDFKETLELLSDRAGIILPTLSNIEDNKTLNLKNKIYEINELTAKFYHENLYKPTSKLAQEYIKKRKLDNKTLKSFQIGYSGNLDELYKFLKQNNFKDEEILASSLVNKNEKGQFIDRFRKRLMFPIQDIKNRVIAFGGRVLDDSLPKYINSPENLVYSKGRHLYGLNLAKKSDLKKIIIVEGYMDAVSLHQRGISNAVASLGTALTEAQGRLLRKYGEQVIISYDSDVAGQAATLRGLEILNNLGCDVRILQMEDAKDPDEYVIKYGSGRFNNLIEKAISLVEFKVKVLKQSLNIENINDKIKFLNEIAKILSKVDNNIEQELYIDKISEQYNISKEAIYAEVNKLKYSNNKGSKILEKNKINRIQTKETTNKIPEGEIKRENIILSLLVNQPEKTYEKIKGKITPDDFKNETNKKILKILYEEIEKGNSNITSILDNFDDQEIVNKITAMMTEQIDETEIDKYIQDISNLYDKDKLIERRNEILEKLKNPNLDKNEINSLENELSQIIIKLAKQK